jgi:hypothetical protein
MSESEHPNRELSPGSKKTISQPLSNAAVLGKRMPKHVHGHWCSASVGARVGELVRQPTEVGHAERVTQCKQNSEGPQLTHENVPTKALHMPRFHREEIASMAKAVVLMLWYAFARSVALLTPATQ